MANATPYGESSAAGGEPVRCGEQRLAGVPPVVAPGVLPPQATGEPGGLSGRT
ncbi:MAG: hypothetical protein KME46_34200 [Brasilonema angustatum HA4187-MV1]|nr:hypothetical protein [Brasilonema angustatum HA4187-MV1]